RRGRTCSAPARSRSPPTAPACASASRSARRDRRRRRGTRARAPRARDAAPARTPRRDRGGAGGRSASARCMSLQVWEAALDRATTKSYKSDVPPGGSPPAERLVVVPGESALSLVAPHGGRRDTERRPWASARLRMNDLHTASLTAELAHLARAPAVINDTHD